MRKFFFFSLTILLVVTSCTKTEEYVPQPYECECGRITWDGLEHQVAGTAGIVWLDDSLGMPDMNSRKYEATTNIQDEDEDKVHHINTIFEFTEISNIFYTISTTVDTFVVDTTIIDTIPPPIAPMVFITEVNLNEDLYEERTYMALDGTLEVQVSEETETVNFNLNIRETTGGTPSGPILPYSGTFIVEVKEE